MASQEIKYPCAKCDKEVVTEAIECSICYKWCHRICAKLSLKNLNKFSQDDQYWYCFKCCELFPYYNINDDEFDFMNLSVDIDFDRYDLIQKCMKYDEEVAKLREYKASDFENDLENSNYNNLNNSCQYYLESQFRTKISKIKGFAVIHFNFRSIKTSFSEINQFLHGIDRKFDVICLTESWLTSDDNMNEYIIEGYECVNVNRIDKRGGGVMIHVSKSIKYKLVQRMSEAIDGLYECVTIEIETVKGKNTVITCMYRAPGSSIETYLEHLNLLIQKLNNKTFFLVGDFNINLINYETHTGTKHFIDTLFSYGIHPLIAKPTRITLNSCTLIDNIFTNFTDESNSGIVINDISDHLPIFSVFPLGLYHRIIKTPNRYKRLTYVDNIDKLKTMLLDYNWDVVLQSGDVNSAYNTFINVTKDMYNESCPFKRVNYKKIPVQPWLTKGLLKACNKQKTLYKQF